MSEVGVDTIALRFELLKPAECVVRLPGYGRLRASGMAARVETSLPKRWWGHNASVVPIRLVPDAVDQLLAEVREYVRMSDRLADPRNLTVRRLDLARDFDGIEAASEVLGAIAARPQSKLVTVSPTTRGGRTQSVRVGNSSFHAQAYDKHVQDRDHAPPGRVRFEAKLLPRKLDSSWASHHGGRIKVAADLHEPKAETLLRSLFEDLGFNAVPPPDDLWRSVEALDLSPIQKYALVGFLDRERARLPHLLGSRNTLRGYDRRARQLRPNPLLGLSW